MRALCRLSPAAGSLKDRTQTIFLHRVSKEWEKYTMFLQKSQSNSGFFTKSPAKRRFWFRAGAFG
jgi:hypothetical protein